MLPMLAAAATTGPAITAASAIVIDADSGAVLYERNAEDARPIASLTKLFTAWSAVQMAAPARMMTVEPSDLVGEASMGLVAGERLSFDALLHGMLLASGNDAAAVVGRELGGAAGTAGFMQQVNADARALGLNATQLVNPHGLDAPGHVSTARDVATLALAFHQRFPEIEELLGSVSWTGAGHSLINTNTLVGTVPGVIAGKTGVSPAAGTCLLEIVERNGRTLIVVTLGSTAQSAVADTVALIDDGFRRLSGIAAPSANIASAAGVSASDIVPGASNAVSTQQVGAGSNPDAGASRWVWVGVTLLAVAIAASGFGLSPRRRTRRVPAASAQTRHGAQHAQPGMRDMPQVHVRAQAQAQVAWNARAAQAIPAPAYATSTTQMGAVVAHSFSVDTRVTAGTSDFDAYSPYAAPAATRQRSGRRVSEQPLQPSATTQGGSSVPPTPLPVGLLAGTPDAQPANRAARPLRRTAGRSHAAGYAHQPQMTSSFATVRPHGRHAQVPSVAQAERRQVLSDSFADWTRDLPVLARVPATSGD